MCYDPVMSRRKQRLAAEVPTFMKRYTRKRPHRGEPNDRKYDRKVEELVKRMDPVELDALLHGDEDESNEENESPLR